MNVKGLFKDRVSERLKMLKKTSADLSRELGVTPPTVLKYRNGSATPSLDTLVQMAAVLNCSTDYLLGVTDINGTVVAITHDLSPLEREMLTFFKNRTIEEQRKLLELVKIAVK